MTKKALIIEDDQTTAIQLSNLIEKETLFKAIWRSDLGSIEHLLEKDLQIKLVVSLYEASSNSDQERDSKVRHLVETLRRDVAFLSAVTLNNSEILRNENKVVLIDIPQVKRITESIENDLFNCQSENLLAFRK